MMQTYLDADAEALDGFEFLTMAEAGEVGHWSVLEDAQREGRPRRDQREARRVGAADPAASPARRDGRVAETLAAGGRGERAGVAGPPLRGGAEDPIPPTLREGASSASTSG